MPSMPMKRAWSVGTAPRPLSVLTKGKPVLVDQRAYRVFGKRDLDAAAEVEQRFARGGHEFGGQRKARRCRRHHRLFLDEFRQGSFVGDLLDGDVLGYVDQYRARASLAGDMKCFGQYVGNVGGRADDVAVLDDGQGDAEYVDLLECVGAHQRAGHLAGDRDHGHRIEEAVGQAGDQVGCARAGSGQADADPSADSRIAVGGQGRALLVAGEDVTNAGSGQASYSGMIAPPG